MTSPLRSSVCPHAPSNHDLGHWLRERAIPEQTCKDRSWRSRTKPCYVYLLPHKTEGRFKIGMSIDTRHRAANLPEGPHIDYDRAVQVQFISRRRANQVEIMLHKALAGFRLRLPSASATLADGATEWFLMAGLVHAIELLLQVPDGPVNSAVSPLLRLDGKPYVDHSISLPSVIDVEERRRLEAINHNLAQMKRIYQVLSMIALHVRVTWSIGEAAPTPGKRREPAVRRAIEGARTCVVRKPAVSRGRARERLFLHGMREAWYEDVMAVRFEVMSDALWTLKTGDANPSKSELSLVRLIQYQKEDPSTMELELASVDALKKLPGRAQILGIWQTIKARFG